MTAMMNDDGDDDDDFFVFIAPVKLRYNS